MPTKNFVRNSFPKMSKKGGFVHATQFARTDKKGKMIAVLYIFICFLSNANKKLMRSSTKNKILAGNQL